MIVRAGTVLAAALLALALAGCAADDAAKVETLGGGTFNAAALQGTWSTNCVGAAPIYRINTFVYAGNTVTRTEEYYTDSACTALDPANPTRTYSGTFATVDDVSTAAGIATRIVYSISSASPTPTPPDPVPPFIVKDLVRVSGTLLYEGDGGSPLDADGFSTQLNTAAPFNKL